jgi:outer membrane protein
VKNLSVILNIVLAIAVAVLYYLHFASAPKIDVPEISDQNQEATEENNELESRLSASSIYFVNTDSLWNSFDLVKKSQDELKIEKMRLEGQFKTKVEAFEKEYMDLQNRATKGLITAEEAQRKENELMNKQQQLMELKDDLSIKLMDKEQGMNDKINKAIQDYLNKYQKENEKVDFVLTYTSLGGGVLYGRENLDITKEIIEGLNKAHQDSSNQKEQKKK